MAAVPPLNCYPKARIFPSDSRVIGEDGCGGSKACRDVVDAFQKRLASRCQSCEQGRQTRQLSVLTTIHRVLSQMEKDCNAEFPGAGRFHVLVGALY
jgi:hypothetical protein